MIEFVGEARNPEGDRTLEVRKAFGELTTLESNRSLGKPEYFRLPEMPLDGCF